MNVYLHVSTAIQTHHDLPQKYSTLYMWMCIHITTTFSCGHRFHKRESTAPGCVPNIHDTPPPADEKRDGVCDGCKVRKARDSLQISVGASGKNGLLKRVLSVVSAKKERGGERCEERVMEWEH